MPTIPILTGPTGVGKTRLSIDLAELIGGEIVNADSRQFYRGMDIGTAKPTQEEQSRVPHHLIDILDISENFSAGKFLRRAEQVFTDILSRDKIPIVVGGSTLYTYALTHGLSKTPAVSTEAREQLEDEAASKGLEALYRELKRIDPETAATMDETKSQRIIRALEVYRATGIPLSQYHLSRDKLEYPFAIIVLSRERADLYDRINNRVDRMLENGLVDEVKMLQDNGANDNFYPLRSPGYKETIEYLSDRITHDEMVRLIKRNTRRYAKRQMTWFRRYPEKHHVAVEQISASAISDNLDAFRISPSS